MTVGATNICSVYQIFLYSLDKRVYNPVFPSPGLQV